MSTHPKNGPLTGVVLAGGHSTRMGRDKALLTLAKDLTLLDHAINTLRAAGATEVLVSVRPGQSYGKPGTREIVDSSEECGPLAGLVAALTAATTDYVAVLAVDLPEMTPAYLLQLVGQVDAGVGAVPLRGKFFEPLAAVYPRLALQPAHAALSSRSFSLQTLVRELVSSGLIKPVPVEPSDIALFSNWNSPGDCSKPIRHNPP